LKLVPYLCTITCELGFAMASFQIGDPLRFPAPL
jgi:hypothetical protein